MKGRSWCWRDASIAALLLAASAATAHGFTNDFSAYPEGARDCLTAASDQSKCSGDDVNAMNKCLCGNGGDFVMSAARCISRSDAGDLQTVYDTMVSACEYSKTPLSVAESVFMAAGSSSSSMGPSSTSTASGSTSIASSSTSTASSSTSTAPNSALATTITTTTNGHLTTMTSTAGQPTNTAKHTDNDHHDDTGGLSTGAKTGIVVGSVVAAVVGLVLVVLTFMRRRKARRQRYLVNSAFDLQPAAAYGIAQPVYGKGKYSQLSNASLDGGEPLARASATELGLMSNHSLWTATAASNSNGLVAELPVAQHENPRWPVEVPATPAQGSGYIAQVQQAQRTANQGSSNGQRQ